MPSRKAWPATQREGLPGTPAPTWPGWVVGRLTLPLGPARPPRVRAGGGVGIVGWCGRAWMGRRREGQARVEADAEKVKCVTFSSAHLRLDLRKRRRRAPRPLSFSRAEKSNTHTPARARTPHEHPSQPWRPLAATPSCVSRERRESAPHCPSLAVSRACSHPLSHLSQSAEVLVLTYGSLVRQLVADLDDVAAVNKQLDTM